MDILCRLSGRNRHPEPALPNPDQGAPEESGSTGTGFYTSTATMVVYDLESLSHRLDDDVDWWADPASELAEINRRNVLMVGLTFDGFYDLDIVEGDVGAQRYSLHFPSGKVFIGPGEVMTGGGNEPDASCSGLFLDLPPGDYDVGIARSEDRLPSV